MKRRHVLITSLLTTTLFLSSGCGNAANISSSSKPASELSQAPSGTSSSSAAANADPAENGIDGLLLTASDINFKESDLYSDYTKSGYTTVTLNQDSATITGSGVTVDGSTLTITAEGTYVLEGTLNGSITVDAPDDAKVILVLNQAVITSSNAPAISVENADKVTISLPAGTENTITDSDSRTNEELDAAIYSTADLVLNGSGTLTVNSNYKDAIHGKDDIRILDGTYQITAADDAIVGKDRLEIKQGTFVIHASGKGLKTTNTDEDDKGFLYIENGQFDITADDDAIHAATAVWIVDGTFTLHSGDDGIHGDETLTIDGGTISVTDSVEGLEAPEIILNGGTIDIVSSDDGINAAGGNETTEQYDELPSGDEHFPQKNEDMPQQNGNMPQGGNMEKRGSGMPQGGGMMETSDGYLYVNGGTITVHADGDGLDANSSIYQTGGDLIIEGPTNNGNGYLDYSDQYIMTGGSLFASGSTGMLQTISDSSSLCCLTVLYDTTQTAESTGSIRDADGTILFTFTPSKAYDGITYASSQLTEGSTYAIYAGEVKLTEFTMDSTNQTIHVTNETSAV